MRQYVTVSPGLDERPASGRAHLGSVIQFVTQASDPAVSEHAWALLADPATKSAFARVGAVVSDSQRRVGLCAVLGGPHYRVAVLRLSSASPDDCGALLDMAGALANDAVALTSFTEFLVVENRRAGGQGVDEGSLVRGLAALRESDRFRDVIRSLVAARDARYRGTEGLVNVLRLFATVRDAGVTPQLWTVWRDDRAREALLDVYAGPINSGLWSGHDVDEAMFVGLGPVLARPDYRAMLQWPSSTTGHPHLANCVRLAGVLEAGNGVAKQRFWSLWSTEPIVAGLLVSAVAELASARGVVLACERPNYEEATRQLSALVWGDRNNVARMLGSTEMAREPEAMKHFWALWASEPRRTELVRLVADAEQGWLESSRPGAVAALRRADFTAFLGQLAAIPNRQQRMCVLDVLALGEMADGNPPAERFWALWADDVSRAALIQTCADAAGSGISRDFACAGFMALLRLPDHRDQLLWLASLADDPRARIGVLGVIDPSRGCDPAVMLDRVRRTLDKPASAVAARWLLRYADAPASSIGLSRVLRLRDADELIDALPQLEPAALENAPAAIREWFWLCKTGGLWPGRRKPLGAQSLQACKSVPAADRVRVQQCVLEVLARHNPGPARSILNAIDNVDDPNQQMSLLYAVGLAEEARAIVDAVPVQRSVSSTSLKLLVARSVLSPIVSAATALIDGMAEGKGSAVILSRADAVLSATAALRLPSNRDLRDPLSAADLLPALHLSPNVQACAKSAAERHAVPKVDNVRDKKFWANPPVAVSCQIA